MLELYSTHLLASNRSAGTVRTYTNRILGLERQHPDLLAVTRHDLEMYLAARRETHKAETRKSMRSAFCSFYGWAYDEQLIPVDPSARLPKIAIPAPVPRVAPDGVVQMGLLTADPWLTAMIMLARYGCLRLTELTTLQSRQREGDMLRIFGKGEKTRLVPMNDELLHALLTLERLQGPGYYFRGRGTNPHMHPQSVNKIITRHLGWNPHSLRHAGATAAYLATRDYEAVRKFLGHASIATTQRYLHTGFDDVRAAAHGTTIRPPLTTFPRTTIAPPATLPLQEPAYGRRWAA